MALLGDIVESWRRPGAVVGRLLQGPVREDRAFAILMAACGLIYVAQWPALARAAHLDPSVPLNARLGGALMGVVFMAPPLLYLVAALSRWSAAVLGGRGSHYGARVALFWALLATSPLMLAQGLVAGFAGPGAGMTLTGLAVLAAFVAIWLGGLRRAERADTPAAEAAGPAIDEGTT